MWNIPFANLAALASVATVVIGGICQACWPYFGDCQWNLWKEKPYTCIQTYQPDRSVLDRRCLLFVLVRDLECKLMTPVRVKVAIGSDNFAEQDVLDGKAIFCLNWDSLPEMGELRISVFRYWTEVRQPGWLMFQQESGNPMRPTLDLAIAMPVADPARVNKQPIDVIRNAILVSMTESTWGLRPQRFGWTSTVSFFVDEQLHRDKSDIELMLEGIQEIRFGRSPTKKEEPVSSPPSYISRLAIFIDQVPAIRGASSIMLGACKSKVAITPVQPRIVRAVSEPDKFVDRVWRALSHENERFFDKGALTDADANDRQDQEHVSVILEMFPSNSLALTARPSEMPAVDEFTFWPRLR